jgi:hypothetical protein
MTTYSSDLSVLHLKGSRLEQSPNRVGPCKHRAPTLCSVGEFQLLRSLSFQLQGLLRYRWSGAEKAELQGQGNLGQNSEIPELFDRLPTFTPGLVAPTP